ncbi:hypothetical protein BKP45_16175 [Anaerobacillus alkalidiazotrophicus]|uniref:DUF4367 domain-containing protein n=1 Tax=Anaerobacillus alkalidiazotrophicus TaxID=472963 RepID=A0A1S2M416_9BACI|nr:hypothetical protein [Anaerobacillus alkalidiazotrophicus]OIJ18667.1 hypothetical protein BKP45_16175 [Anaerobacillus alkalidiazotrophicus]
MEDKNVDKKIKESLLKNTDESLQQKDEIWKNIERKLASSEENSRKKITNMEENNMKIEQNVRKNRKSKGWVTGTVAAALLLGIFATSTDTGQAFVNNIREYFAPQKQVVEEIEGMPEEKEVVLEEGEAGYIIYIDAERYEMVKEKGVDTIVFKEELDERYPEVSMSIRQVEDKTPQQLADEIHSELKKSFATVDEITNVTEPVDGLFIHAIDGYEWNSPVTQVYIVSNEKEGSFVIEQKFFLEAAEGHGMRFDHMLNEFKIVEVVE